MFRVRHLVSLALPVLLSGCLVLAAAGTGSSVGYLATEDRTMGENADDIVACTQTIQMWAAYDTKLNDGLNCRTYQGRMLVTGTVPTQAWKDEAIASAWKAKNVKEVYDEILVGPGPSFGANARDALSSEKLKAKLLTDSDVRSNNYIVTTDSGVLYILGTARDPAERDRVIGYARNIPDVKRVVTYIRIRADKPAPATANANGPAYTPTGAPTPSAPGDTSPDAPTPRGDIAVTPLK